MATEMIRSPWQGTNPTWEEDIDNRDSVVFVNCGVRMSVDESLETYGAMSIQRLSELAGDFEDDRRS